MRVDTWISPHSTASFSEPVLRQDIDTPVLLQILRPGLQSTQETAIPRYSGTAFPLVKIYGPRKGMLQVTSECRDISLGSP